MLDVLYDLAIMVISFAIIGLIVLFFRFNNFLDKHNKNREA
jgi:hypothetical protein